MARLIVKSPYIKCGGGRSAGGYMRYIATRERVELIQDDRPPTRKQEQLIAKLMKDFPDARELDEYGDYEEHPTKANASAFISQALEENWSDVQKSDGYMKYIATRPRAERLGSHGLFGDKDGVELDKAMAELENYTGNVWTHIISLKREDADRLGYDNARAWRNLLRAHRNDIASAMSIPPQDFRWYPYGFGSNLTVFTITDPERIGEKAVANWENSPGHLATMIDPNCDAVGVGVTIENGRAFCYMFVGNPTAHNPYA